MGMLNVYHRLAVNLMIDVCKMYNDIICKCHNDNIDSGYLNDLLTSCCDPLLGINCSKFNHQRWLWM